ncbi:MAG: aminotransferase class III-fold pyridoxal phosphate-dependent enzyme, partial [Anaerolineae bacterium]|nr:aminotransferase class III-fold pyridoxal phosphate-dependent enzyme [Anaerolineae bacterium]
MTDLETFIPHVSSIWPHLLETIIVRGEGAYVWDQTGRRYLDFTSGIGVTNTGHCHPRVVAAIREQAGRILHLQANFAYHEPMLRLIAALRQVVPSELNTFFFTNSGAEAVEAAVKLARHATGRTNIIAFQRGFHGRTVGTMSLTSSK